MRRVLSRWVSALNGPPVPAPEPVPDVVLVDDALDREAHLVAAIDRANELAEERAALIAAVTELAEEKAALVKERDLLRGELYGARLERDNAVADWRDERGNNDALRAQLGRAGSDEARRWKAQAEQDRRNCVDMQQKLLDLQRDKDLVDLELLWVTNGRRVSAEGRARLGVDS